MDLRLDRERKSQVLFESDPLDLSFSTLFLLFWNWKTGV